VSVFFFDFFFFFPGAPASKCASRGPRQRTNEVRGAPEAFKRVSHMHSRDYRRNDPVCLRSPALRAFMPSLIEVARRDGRA